MWARMITICLGLWLMAAPAILGYGGAAHINDRIIGPLAASCAMIAISEVMRPVRRVNMVLGLWLIAAPWVLGYAMPAGLNSTLVGVLMMICASVRGKLSQHFGGGWASLLTSHPSPHEGSQTR